MIIRFYTLHIWNTRIRYADNNNGQNGISVGLKRNNRGRFTGTFKNSRSHGDSSYAGTVTIIRGAARLRIFFLFLPAITKGTIHSTEQELRPMRAGNSFLRSSTRRRRETRVHSIFQGFWIRWTAAIRIVDYLLPEYDVRLALCSFSVQVPGANYADCSRLANDESLADSGREIQIDLAIGRRVFRV